MSRESGRSYFNVEPTLDEMLNDDVMATVLRSAGMDAKGFRDMIIATARREVRETVGADSGGC